MEYNWTGINVKLLAGCILLFQIGTILVSCKESRHSFCTLHESLYWASGTPSDIYWCAKNNPTENCSSPGAQSFAPIGLHKTDAASDWLFIKQPCIGTKGLPGSGFLKGLHPAMERSLGEMTKPVYWSPLSFAQSLRVISWVRQWDIDKLINVNKTFLRICVGNEETKSWY